jgi:hypothetical protein
MKKELFAKLKENIFSQLGILGIFLFLSFVMFGFIFKSSLADISVLTNAEGITVSGTSERYVVSDKGTLTLNLKVDSLNMSDKEALKMLSDSRDSLIKYLVQNGIDSKNIDVLSYTTYSQCSRRDNISWDNCVGKRYTEYTQVINVSADNVNVIKDLSLNINTKVNSQLANYFDIVNLSVQNTQYFYSKFSDIKSDILKEATKNAFERAEAIANSTGNSAGAVITASQGVFQVTAKDSIDSQDYGVYDTSTIEKKITAVVRVSFKVK